MVVDGFGILLVVDGLKLDVCDLGWLYMVLVGCGLFWFSC
jgi:hypothetical protein